MPSRIDAAELTKAMRTPQGFLRAPAFATRTGVFTYRFPDGSVRRELRHPEDVFNSDSLATLAGVPFTNDHPNVKNPRVTLITPENVRDFMVGFTGDDVAPVDERFVGVSVTITDSAMIKAVEAGKVEVSCGYHCDHEDVPGTYNGEPYDVRQRNIVYNHLAGVDRGRAGPDVRLRLDAADAVQVSDQPLEAANMEKITINGVEYEVTAAVAAAYRADQAAKLDAAQKAEAAQAASVAAVTARADKAEARCDGLKVELDKATTALAAKTDAVDPAAVDKRVKARLRIVKVAERVLAADELAKLDSADDKAIMSAVIMAEQKTANLEGKSDAYVEARFDGIAEALDAGGAATGKVGKELHKTRADGAESDAEAARKRQRERAENAWKPKET